MERLIKWVIEEPKTRIPILVALIAFSGVIVGGFFTTIVWPWVKLGFEKLWDKVANRFSKTRFEKRYLDWVIAEHQYLPLLPSTLVPVTQVKKQELDKLYVALSVATTGNEQKDVGLGEGLRGSTAIVILGDPGAGKTTMLRFLALTFAQAKRKRSSAKDLDVRSRDNSNINKARERVKKQFEYANYPLPIFLYLNRYRDVLSWTAGRSLLDALRDEWKAVDSLRDIPIDFFDRKLNRGECIFLLDAFDELGTQSARDAIASHIGQLAATAAQGNRFIVTSRVVGYSGQLSKYGFDVLKVQRLSWNLISELVTKWYDALNDRELAAQLLSTLKTNDRIAELAVNPMLLSLIVLVQYVKRIIPDRRHLLYDECVRILVERRYAPPLVQQAYNNVLPGEEATFLLQKIAQNMHSAHLREIPRHRLEDEVIPDLLTSMPDSVALTVRPIDVLKNIEERSQLLVERGLNDEGEPVMGFSHLTFQEYLTSVAQKEMIPTRGEKNVSKALLDKYSSDPEWWEEVALLYAAQLGNEHRALFFKQLYPEDPAV